MATHFMKKADQHPGKFSAKARRAGVSTHTLAERDKHKPGTLGKEARLDLIYEKERPKGHAAHVAAEKAARTRKRRHSGLPSAARR